MSIVELEFHDDVTDWHLSKTDFGPTNLLVGNSGVGKTKILNAIRACSHAANGFESVHRCSWNIKVLANNGLDYSWRSIISSQVVLEDRVPQRKSLYLDEEISQGDTLFVKRTPESFRFNNQDLPRFKNTESAISLLRDDDSIRPIHEALSRIISSRLIHGEDLFEGPGSFVLQTYDSLESLRSAVDKPILTRSLAMQQQFPDSFNSVVRGYKEIFPTVTDVKIGHRSEFGESIDDPYDFFFDSLTVGIMERSVKNWIYGSQISAGMLRTFLHLIELELAPPRTVFLIDEIENSLGVNCLSIVIDRLHERLRDLQFIMTSHHPYIINNISIDDWQIVTRKGSTVTVKRASEIPALNGQSRQEKFLRLINAPEFEDGIQ